MNKFINNAKAFMNDEEGLSVVEYVVGAALLVVALGSVFSSLGSSLSTKLSGAVS
ncbi:Flp family type IVb pilin [Vibrio makurazakiensis]|uniref:Flp family type IVb pilin n=1 Tax=Vibrio makurazakiensis TaxID=2910250 RepID=UPI003D1146DF